MSDLSIELVRLVDRHSRSAAAYWKNDRRCEELLDAYNAYGRSKATWEPLRDAERLSLDLLMVCYPTYNAILDFPAASLADVQAKVGVIRTSPAGGEMDPEEVIRLFTSIVGGEA